MVNNNNSMKAYMKGLDHANKGGQRKDNPYTQRYHLEQWFNGFDDAKQQLLPMEFNDEYNR